MDRSGITRETSLEAFKQLIDSGVLGAMRGVVWAWLFRHGPATRNEVAHGINMVPNDCSTRLKELVDMGNAREVGEDRCRITGRNVILYDVTKQTWAGMLPKRRGKGKPIIQGVTCCEECPLVALDEDSGAEVCGLNTKLLVGAYTAYRPMICKLNERDVLLRGM